MKTVILDTDFILSAVKGHIELDTSIKPLFMSQVEITYLDKTIRELESKPLGTIAKKILEKYVPIKTEKKKTVDALIMDLAKHRKNLIVATQDKKLKEKLKKAKIQTITIRQQKYVSL